MTCLLYGNLLIGQNWQPISTTAITSYKSSPSTSDSVLIYGVPNFSEIVMKQSIQSLYIDSTINNQYYFNRQQNYHPQTLYNGTLKAKMHFLNEKMIEVSPGLYHFYSPDSFQTGYYTYQNTPDSFVINTLANVNESWIYKLNQPDIATVVAADEEYIFGVLDSIKIITVNTGDSIVLSKNYGIIHFSDAGQSSYQLAGIETAPTQNYGLKMPNTYDVYDFEVGNVFNYISSYNFGGPGGAGNSNVNTVLYRYDIMTKQVTATGFSYSVDYNFIETHNYDSDTVTGSGNTTWVFDYAIGGGTDFTKQAFEFTNSTTNSAIMLGGCGQYQDSSGRQYETYFYRGYFDGFHKSVLSPHLGEIYNYDSQSGLGNSIFSSKKLTGYYIDGVLAGDTIPKAVYNSIHPLQNAELALEITPNPAHDIVQLTITDHVHTNEAIHVQVLNVQGKPLKKQFHTDHDALTVDVSDLPSGVYLLKVEVAHFKAIRKIVVAH